MISVSPVFYWGIYKPVIPAQGLITNLPISVYYAIIPIADSRKGCPYGIYEL